MGTMSRRWIFILVSLCTLLLEGSPSLLRAQGPYPPQMLSPNGLFYGPGGYAPGFAPIPYFPGLVPAGQLYGPGPSYFQPGYQQPAYNPNGYTAPGGPPGFSPNFNPNTGVAPNPQPPGIPPQGLQFQGVIPGQNVPGPGYGGFYAGTAPYSAYGYGQQRPALPPPGYGQPIFNGNSAYPNGYPNPGAYPNAGPYANPGNPNLANPNLRNQIPGAYSSQGNFGVQPQTPYATPQNQPSGSAIDPRSPFWQRQMQQLQPLGPSQSPPPQQPQFQSQPQPTSSPFLRKHMTAPPSDYLETRPRTRGNAVTPIPSDTGSFVPFPGAPITNISPEQPLISRPHELLPRQPSTLEQQARSVHFQGQGDIWFRQQNYLQAYSRYKQAAGAAPDLATPRFRMAYAMIALKRYEVAVEEMARGIQLDPRYPITGDSPAKVFGPDNQIAAGALTGQVADWVKQEIRSPDRLFLLGALLRMNGDVEKSRICFEAAAQLGGQPPPVMTFLKLDPPAGTLARTARPRIPQDDQAPVPEAVEELLRNKANWAPVDPNQPDAVSKPIGRPHLGPKLPGPKQIGPIPLGIQPPGKPGSPTTPGSGQPGDSSDVNELESLPVTPPMKEDVEPAAGTAPAVPEKPTPPGFQAIPKKGSKNPSGNDQAPEVTGPVIPIPQSGN
jgi:hypothetical protein